MLFLLLIKSYFFIKKYNLNILFYIGNSKRFCEICICICLFVKDNIYISNNVYKTIIQSIFAKYLLNKYFTIHDK